MSNTRERKLREKLDLRDFKLKALLEVTQAINAQSSEEALMSRYVDALKAHLGIDRLGFTYRDRRRRRLMVAEGTQGNCPTVNLRVFRSLGPRWHRLDWCVGRMSPNDGRARSSTRCAHAVVLVGDTSEDVQGESHCQALEFSSP